MTNINQSYNQRTTKCDFGELLEKIDIKPLTLRQLSKKIKLLNMYKDGLSSAIGHYLKNRRMFKCELDINRKCRALGIPPYLTGINVYNQRLLDAWKNIRDQTSQYAERNNGKIIKPCNVDINELCVYAKMYQEIDIARRLSPYFYAVNCFNYIMYLMNMGSVITRFKYVKDGDKKPVEKLITYHLFKPDSELVSNNILMIHIEGEDKIHGWKRWGLGDETITQFGNDKIIRWGIDDFDKKRKFTY